MSKRAWIFIASVIGAALVLTWQACSAPPSLTPSLPTFLVLLLLAAIAQLFEVQAPNCQSYYPAMVFFFAGTLLLPPVLGVLIVTLPHLLEWAKIIFIDKRSRPWYIQPFNIATHIMALFAAQALAGWGPAGPGHPALVVAAMILSAFSYLMVNHLLIGQVLVLARGSTWRGSGVLALENLLSDLIMLLLGGGIAILWQLNPWAVVLALSPLVLMYRALAVPQLKQEAQTDSKTGLWNARSFRGQYLAEFERARRFTRPLAVIVADLDLLRNINNTYGHLAGDIVLIRVSQLIAEATRQYDIAARFGGEEFIIALPETTLDEAATVAERLRQSVEAATMTVPNSGTTIKVTISLGVATFPADADDPEALIHAADIAVYQAKLRGRNRVVRSLDIPRSLRAEMPQADGQDAAPAARPPARLGAVDHPYLAAAARPIVQAAPVSAAPVAPPGRAPAGAPAPSAAPAPNRALRPFVGAVIAAGAAVALLGITTTPTVDPWFIVGLALLALIAEVLQIDVYGDNTVSVSVGLVVAAALLGGVPGVIIVGTTITCVHAVQRRPVWYKIAFNWSAHLLAGLVPALALGIVAVPLRMETFASLVVLGLAVTGIYFLVESGLVAMAMSLAQGTRVSTTWNEHFRWMTGHYLVLGLLALVLAIGIHTLGWVGLAAFILPVFLSRHAQGQFVERTDRGMRELRRLNHELLTANQEVHGASQVVQQVNEELYTILARVIDLRDPFVASHAIQAANYAVAIGQELDLPAERLQWLRQAALLHDIGKLGISERVLHKPARLTPDEYEYMKTHAALGAELVETCQGLRPVASFIRHHHERWDGGGYPAGLRGEAIPLEARIIAVCDAVEAMASDRPYKKPMALPDILAELRRCAGTQFDPTVVNGFLRVMERQGSALVTNSALVAHAPARDVPAAD